MTKEEAFKLWWRTLTLQGDPAHRHNLTTEAFNAGWKFAVSDIKLRGLVFIEDDGSVRMPTTRDV